MEWTDNNCCHCRKYDPEAPFEETACEIERDISMIPFTGGISEAIYEREEA